jgi:hypothetical protein
MISSWKSWLSEEGTALLLCLLGIAIGLMIGYFIKDGAISFHSIEVIGYQIPSAMSYGIFAGFIVQLVSVVLSWLALGWSIKSLQSTNFYYTWIFEILTGIPMGTAIVFDLFSGYSVTFGFVVSHVIAILLTPVVMIIVGWNTMHLLWFNVISLLPLYLVLTGITWFVEFCRSIV